MDSTNISDFLVTVQGLLILGLTVGIAMPLSRSNRKQLHPRCFLETRQARVSCRRNGKAPLGSPLKEHPATRITTLSNALATGWLVVIRSPIKHRCEKRSYAAPLRGEVENYPKKVRGKEKRIPCDSFLKSNFADDNRKQGS